MTYNRSSATSDGHNFLFADAMAPTDSSNWREYHPLQIILQSQNRYRSIRYTYGTKYENGHFFNQNF